MYNFYEKYFGLRDQVAIVTGAGNGIGCATAIMLAKAGVKVTVNDINEKSALETCKEIRENGGIALCSAGDASNIMSIKKTVEDTLDEFKRIDILVNNAAIGGTGKSLIELSYEEYDKLVDVNLNGVFRFCKEVIPYMIKQNRGKVVNISSGAGITGNAGSTHYASAKAGLIGLSKSMAKELAQYRINVNVLGVGLTVTNMSRTRGLEHQIPLVPWPRIGQPEDQAAVILFLVSEAAEYITGQVICPNGGSWM